VSFGGDGNDDLWAMARADVTALGDQDGDSLSGDAGDDTFHVRDGERDVVVCGAGTDRVIADQFDMVDASCERVVVVRLTTLTTEDGAENKTEAPPEDRRER